MTTPGSGFGLGSPPGGDHGSLGGPSILGGSGPVPAGGRRPSKKRGGGGLAALVVVALLLLGGIVALMVFLLGRKGGSIAADPSTLPPKQASIAYKHLPPGCEVVVRANLAQVLEVPAVKTHLVPVLDEMQTSDPNDPHGRALEELLRSAGIDAKRDVKDVALCLRGTNLPRNQRKMLFVLGGDLRPEALVPALEQGARSATDKPAVTKSDGRLVLRANRDGQTLVAGQAADAAIVFTNDEALFAAAMRESSSFLSEYALPTAPEAAVVVGPAAMRDAVTGGGPNPFLKDLDAVTRIVGTASAAEARLELRLGTTSPQSAKSLLDVYTLVLGPMLKQQLGGARAKAPGVSVLSNAQPRVDGNDFVLSAQGTSADVEAVAKELARALREERRKGSLEL
jgi:hypothetical protein